MRKLLHFGFAIGFASLSFFACNRQESITPVNAPLENLKTDIGVVNGILAFKNTDTYESHLQKLNSVPKAMSETQFLSKLESDLGFQSKRSLATAFTNLSSGRTLADEGIYDDHLASILNKDNMVQIDKWIFKLDLLDNFPVYV
jgi:hypothetical protein